MQDRVLIQSGEEKLIKQLEEIAGLDITAAVRTLGQREIYYQILRQFCSGMEETVGILKDSAEKGDWKSWTLRVHSLKSVLRTIGMRTLGEEAAQLEEVGRAEVASVCRERTITFCTALIDLQKKLRGTGLFTSLRETVPTKIRLGVLQDKLIALKYACNGHNSKEIEARLADIRNVSLSETADKSLLVISSLIDSFDYDEAVDKIDRLLHSLQKPQHMEEFSILIIDDEEINLQTLQFILGTEYILSTACTGADALRQLEDNLPDLILLDIMLPDISGFELLEKLKSNPATVQIPVIIVTGLSGEEEEERGFFLGAVDYITKPFNNAIVRARVKTHIRMISHIRTIEKLSMIDPLTSIANRRSFDKRMRVEWKLSQREDSNIAFLMIDIDKFKDYNDTYGHPQGDVLLKAVAHTIETSILRASDLVARLGGEEFGVILPDTSLEDSLVVAERIRANVASLQVPLANGFLTRITISIGVVSASAQTMSMEDFISQADKNLYKAKEEGRNRVSWGAL